MKKVIHMIVMLAMISLVAFGVDTSAQNRRDNQTRRVQKRDIKKAKKIRKRNVKRAKRTRKAQVRRSRTVRNTRSRARTNQVRRNQRVRRNTRTRIRNNQVRRTRNNRVRRNNNRRYRVYRNGSYYNQIRVAQTCSETPSEAGINKVFALDALIAITDAEDHIETPRFIVAETTVTEIMSVRVSINTILDKVFNAVIKTVLTEVRDTEETTAF